MASAYDGPLASQAALEEVKVRVEAATSHIAGVLSGAIDADQAVPALEGAVVLLEHASRFLELQAATPGS